MLEWALRYAGLGWYVFPVNWVIPPSQDASARQAMCSCGNAACDKIGKHPLIKWRAGATKDPNTIRRLWRKWPQANIAVATGPSGLIVLDPDGPTGMATLQAAVEKHGRLPPTLVCRTGRADEGFHLYFQGDPIASYSNKTTKLDVRSRGGYALLPPSNHLSGRRYEWANSLPIAAVPEWVPEWRASLGGSSKTKTSLAKILGDKPSHLQPPQAAQALTARAIESAKPQWSVDEEERIREALRDTPSDDYHIWVANGMALKWLESGPGWQRPDGTSIAFDLWDDWSKKADSYSQAGCEEKWTKLDTGTGITIATVFHNAREAVAARLAAGKPAESVVPACNGYVNGTALTLPAPLLEPTPIRFADWTKEKHAKPLPTCTNARIALHNLGIVCRKDTFHEKMIVGGHRIAQWAGDLQDEAVLILRKIIKDHYFFDPGERNMRDAAMQLCLEHPFNPVLDYLDALQWDGVPRIDRWVVDYLGAAPTELNCEIGRLMLLAAVRRARHPGCKFDQIVVLEGKQGAGKSTALKILAGEENFSEQHILGESERNQQEAFQGVWIHEIAELAGLRRTEVERIKQFLSRTEDRARPAYARFRMDLKRRGIFAATTNDDAYLKDPTGNRRFWPLEVTRIDLVGLTVDRNQLWAEAALREREGASIELDDGLWDKIAAVQEERLEHDAWIEKVENYVNEQKITDCTVWSMLNMCLGFHISDIDRAAQIRIGNILRSLGFQKKRKREGKALIWNYHRDVPEQIKI